MLFLFLGGYLIILCLRSRLRVCFRFYPLFEWITDYFMFMYGRLSDQSITCSIKISLFQMLQTGAVAVAFEPVS